MSLNNCLKKCLFRVNFLPVLCFENKSRILENLKGAWYTACNDENVSNNVTVRRKKTRHDSHQKL